MLTYDPRTISTCVYHNLNTLKQNTPDINHQKEQKSQALELYSYIGAWGLLRLKAEEFALIGQANTQRQRMVQVFFETLGQIAFPDETNVFINRNGLDYLIRRDATEYLGFTGLALKVAREFTFWVEALYPEV